MKNSYDPEDPTEIEKWTRYYYNIEGETVDAYLIRKGFTADTPDGAVQRWEMALAWIKPQVTVHTQPIISEMLTIVATCRRDYSMIRDSSSPRRTEDERHAGAKALDERFQTLFNEAKALHRLQPVLNAQAKYRDEQSKRASRPRKLTEDQHKRIARQYWESKRDGEAYGAVKALAKQYNVSTNTINSIAKKYKPE